MTKLAVTFAVLVSLALPAMATAGERVDTDPIATAMAAAATYWRGVPCGGHVHVEAEAGSEVQAVTGSPYGALTSFMTPVGANAVTQPPSTFTDCSIRLSSEWRSSWAWDDQEYEALCQLMVHEYGHLEGFSDAGAAPDTVESLHPETAPLVAPCRHYRLLYYEHGRWRPDVYEYELGSWN